MSLLPPMAVLDRATSRRDAGFDGVFVVAVKTTGIFCRPSCPARPLPQNREFFATAAEALRAGYRPCKRCRPLLAGGAVPEWVTQLLDRVESAPDRRVPDKELVALGLDPVAARRAFLKHFGMTFQAYCRGRRLGEAFQRVRKGEPLDTVAADHGYESLSGFRDAFAKSFGAPPRKADGPPIMLAWVETPVSPLIVGASDDGLCLLEFTERDRLDRQLRAVQAGLGRPVVPGQHPIIEQAKGELAEYFAGERRDFFVPLAPIGTAFQRSVWDQLLAIPYGQTRSYAEIAEAVSRSPAGCRAIGQANGRNRICIIIPCHRVVNKDGTLGGYGGGLWRKRFLLELERKAVASGR